MHAALHVFPDPVECQHNKPRGCFVTPVLYPLAIEYNRDCVLLNLEGNSDEHRLDVFEGVVRFEGYGSLFFLPE